MRHLLLLLLGGAAVLLGGGNAGSSAHTLQYFKVAISEPGQGLPQFIIVAYLDDQLFMRYDSNTQKMLPQVPWVRKVEQEDSSYWEKQTRLSRNWERFFQVDLRSYHNHSKGVHIWQWTHGCWLSQDRSQGGHTHFGYDGSDFLSLDLQTLTWVGGNGAAHRAKRMWDANITWTQDRRHFVEVVCIAWLQKFLDYAKESLQRTEAPTVMVARKKGYYDGQETLICQLYGFYPKEIEVTWMKDEEDQRPDTFTGGVVPNLDGTYYTWLSIDVDPKERDRFRCHVEHDGLLEPLDLAWGDPASKVGLIVGVLLGIVAAVILVGAGVIFHISK
uniref:major histocompatibility complex class I-related gene protein-like n=1 Tax=Euleptes europaea TaxID=460621 RepID=UPI002541CC2C|nr:major histocompatibility complex class I-related gene protein-like [Euleptes europaea]